MLFPLTRRQQPFGHSDQPRIDQVQLPRDLTQLRIDITLRLDPCIERGIERGIG